MDPTLLILSLLPLLGGPLVVMALRSVNWASRFLDGLVMVSVAGIVLLHILPAAIARGGGLAVAAAVLGLALPFAVERLLGYRSDRAQALVLALGFFALALHSTMDGIALCGTGHEHDGEFPFLGVSVALHRLPVGIAIWWIVVPRHGLKAGLFVMGTIVAGSIAGFVWQTGTQDVLAGSGWAVFQALVAGSLLHVALAASHAPYCSECEEDWQTASGLGGLVAVILLAALSILHGGDHSHELETAGATFWSLALKSAPALLLAYVVAGALHGLFPNVLSRTLGGGGTLSQAGRGSLVGLPVSVCSCGILPLYRSLILKGVPAPAAIAFLVAAPEIGVASILLSFQLLGVEIGLVRIVVALGLALLMGVWIGTMAARSAAALAQEHEDGLQPVGSIGERLRLSLEFAFGEMVDETIPWLLVGMGLAAVVAPLLGPGFVGSLPPGLDVPLMALIGTPVYVCATGSTPFAAMLMAKGLSPGAAIAFLLVGPATNVTTFGILSRMHGRKVSVLFALGVAGLATVFGYGVNLVLPAGIVMPDFIETHEHASWLEQTSLAVMAVLTLVSLVRQGSRGFVSQIITLDAFDAEHKHG
ncbi:MAG: permease [Deltaproteobacteria bacterium]|nr:permease [Deltaproteobacteria bacterium]